MENQDFLYWTEICALYPDSWVLTGIPPTEAQKNWKMRKYKILYQSNDKETFDEVSLKTITLCREQKMYEGYFDSYTGSTQKVAKRTGLLKKAIVND